MEDGREFNIIGVVLTAVGAALLTFRVLLRIDGILFFGEGTDETLLVTYLRGAGLQYNWAHALDISASWIMVLGTLFLLVGLFIIYKSTRRAKRQ